MTKQTKTSPKAVAPVDDNEIRFYRSNEKPYGRFSNLFRSPIEFEGQLYPTAEHAYQAGKAQKAKVRDWILAAPSPSLAAMAAHGLYAWDIVPKWSEIKFDRMRGVLAAKFTQHPDLMELLLATGDKRLVEAGTTNNAVNRLWGEVNGVGQNMLGQMLMELQSELRGKNRKTQAVKVTKPKAAKSRKAQAKRAKAA